MDTHKNIQYQLRLPPELKAWLHEQAKSNYRSLNAEIITHLANVKNSLKSIEIKEKANATA